MRTTTLATLLTAATAVTGIVGAPGAAADQQAGVDAGWVKTSSFREFTIAWRVPGAIPGRRGNVHLLSADYPADDIHIHITDYRCPSPSSATEDCSEVDSGNAWTDQVELGQFVTYAGDGGIDVTTSLDDSGELSGPLRLRIRPARGMHHTPYAWGYELFETFRVTVSGRIGPIELADARIQTAELRRLDGLRWVGPGAPHRETPAVQRQRQPLVLDYRESGGHWVRMGTAPGRPGNAHSGQISAGAYLKGDHNPRHVGSFEVNDWQCPAGVRPPVLARRDAPCTLLRTEHVTPNAVTTVAAEADGARGLHLRDTVATTVLTPTAVTSSHRSLDVTFQPAGDTIAYGTSDPGDRWTDRLFLSSTVSGRVGGVDLATAEVGGGHSRVLKVWQDRP